MILKLGRWNFFKYLTGHTLKCYRVQSANYARSVRNIEIDFRFAKIVAPPNCIKRITPYPNCFSKCYSSAEGVLDRLTFETICSETLDSLTEYFEELVETVPLFKNADVTYSDGVLNVYLGKSYGTYVINRQSPNLQIWLSSPVSGPKRYDYIGGTWIYKHDQTTLHSLLDKEIESIIQQKVEFTKRCTYSKCENSFRE